MSAILRQFVLGLCLTILLPAGLRGGEMFCAPGWHHDVSFASFAHLAHLRHSATHGRHLAKGHPLKTTSWLNRPLYVGWFLGVIAGDEVLTDRVGLGNDFFGGYRVGVDFDHFWGAESRWGMGSPDLYSIQQPQYARTAKLRTWDISLLYYPWGDAQWRPYFSAGLGATNIDYRDDFGVRYDETVFMLPLGVGVKHHFRRWLSLRGEIVNNISFDGNQVDAMNNVSFNLGVEVHYGFRRRSYWPWNPSRHTWQ